jgi:TolA-binding protein
MKFRPVLIQLTCLAAVIQVSLPPTALAQGWEVNYSQAQMYLNQGDYSNAMAYMNKAIAEASEEGHTNDDVAAQLLHWLGRAYFKQGDYASAETQFHAEQRILQQAPTNPIDQTSNAPSLAYCQIALGDTRLALGDYDGAARNFQRAIDNLQTLPETYDVQGTISEAQQKLAKCQQYLKNTD